MNFHEKYNVSLYLDELTLLEKRESNLQRVEIYNHATLGNVLIIDDEVQNVENWAALYHESIVHIPMMFLTQPRIVLILGGGDLYAAEIVLKYPSVEKLIICDHDINVIELTQKFYLHANSVLKDPRLQIIYTDAKIFLENTQTQFDLIIDDCFNLVDHFTEREYIFSKLYNILNPNEGICSSLMYRHIFDKIMINKTKKLLFSNYNTILSLITVPEYPGILHLLTMWGTSKYLTQNLNETRNNWHLFNLEKRYDIGKWFNASFCKYYLYLPPYIKELL